MAKKRTTPQDYMSMSPAQMRKEYSHLRSIANKRIQRIKDFNPNFHKPAYSTIKGLNGSVEEALADVQRYLSSGVSTLPGYKSMLASRSKAEQTLAKQMDIPDTIGGRHIGAFMDSMRTKYGKQVNSDLAMDVYVWGKRNKVPARLLRNHYEEFKDKLDTLETVEKKYDVMFPSGGSGTAYLDRIRQLIDKEE